MFDICNDSRRVIQPNQKERRMVFKPVNDRMMKTLLVPVDFTATTDNAISYAVEWAKDNDYKRIILLKSLYDSMFDHLIAAADYVNVNRDYLMSDREEALNQLKTLCNQLIAKVEPHIKVSLFISEEPLLRSIIELVADEKPQLVVVGSDNASYSSNSYVAGQVINIAKASPVRTLIVPAHFNYQPVKQVLVPVDFDTLPSLSKLDSYRATTRNWNHKKLLVLNVDPKEKHLHPDEEFNNAEDALHRYLKNFSHEVHYSSHKNIINGIVEFSSSHEAQLIVALPGRHSFLYSLTHNSISEAIYLNAKMPVLILK